MRPRDETKQQALYQATVDIVNSDGFASASVNKIAKHAGISAGTLYVYFENKEALLTETFLTIKEDLSSFVMGEFDPSFCVKENVRAFWFRLFEFVSTRGKEYQYIDQFSNSPFIQLVNSEDLELPYRPFYQALNKGIDRGIIKDIPKPMLLSFILAPAVFLARSRLGAGFSGSQQDIDTAFSLAWDAITH